MFLKKRPYLFQKIVQNTRAFVQKNTGFSACFWEVIILFQNTHNHDLKSFAIIFSINGITLLCISSKSVYVPLQTMKPFDNYDANSSYPRTNMSFVPNRA